MREKLKNLIIDAKRTDPETGSFTEYLTDYLIENGVVIPVRCGECDWYRKEDGGICLNAKCSKSYYGCRVPAQHFCSYGEPKESEE